MTDLDDIIGKFDNLSFSKNPVKSSTISTKMTELKINWELFKSKLDNIRNFDGDSNTLNKFIKRCESFIDSYSSMNSPDLEKHIFECIQEKLIGRAEVMVGNRAELNDWVSLKNALIQCFSDRRDIDCLVQELTRTRPFKNEHLLNFGSRLQLLRSNVIQRVSNDTNLNREQKLCHISYFDKTALNTFIAGCTGTLKNNMHIKTPKSLEDAIAYVTEFENFERLYGQCNNVFDKPKNNFQNPKHNTNNFGNQNFNSYNQNNPNNSFNNQNPQNNFSNYRQNNVPNFNNTNYNHQNHQNKPAWPCQPINIQTRQVPPQRFPTNREVFGPPVNVFKPKPIPPGQLPKPEPMSTTSRIPSLNSSRGFSQNSYNRNRMFDRNPNFNFQELYSNDCSTEENYTDSTENYCDQNTTDYNQDEDTNQYIDNNQYNEYQYTQPGTEEMTQEQNFQDTGPTNQQS